MKALKKLLGAALVAAAFGPVASQAATVSMLLNTSINGSSPAGTLTATFADTGAGEVTLTMTNNLVGSEFDVFWLFNVNPIPNPLTITFDSGQAALNVLGSTSGSPSMAAGLFDFGFQWPLANNPGRFIPGETSVYKLTGTGLDALDFVDYSQPNGNDAGGWLSAARIQGIAGGLSGTIGTGECLDDEDCDGITDDDENPVPEPGSLALAGLALAGLAASRRRRSAR